MAQQLTRNTFVYRVDTEDEALALIQDYKDRQITDGFTVSKSSYNLKTKRKNGEVVDSWFVASITIDYEV